MGIKADLIQLERDLRGAGLKFAVNGLRARGGRLTAPLTFFDRFGKSAKQPDGRLALEIPGLVGSPVIVRRGGSDFWIIREIFRDHGYDLSDSPAVFSNLQTRYEAILAGGKTPVIIDAGANIGAAARWFKQTYQDAAIVTVEPDPANCAVMRENLAGLDGVTIIEAAIGARSGFVTLNETPDSCAFQTTRADSGLPIVTISEAINKVANGTLFLVKIDIEGFEHDLFSENLDWIGDAAAVFIEPHDWMLPGQGTSRNFQRAMAAHDFELLIRGENLVYVRG